MTAKQQTNKERFCSLLRNTGRENIDYVIEDLEGLGFFEAPASSRNHYNFEGGLVEHSLNVYDAAMALRKSLIELKPTLEEKLPVESVTIASLLHDVCKADIYRKVTRGRKNEIGMYERTEEYALDYSNFPVGHGEKSVIMLLRSGLDLEDNEILAIRWHMGPWEIDRSNREQDGSYRQAGINTPLVPLIHAADSFAAALMEKEQTLKGDF